MKRPELKVPRFVALQLVTQSDCPDAPSRHHLISLLTTLAFVFQINPAAERGTDVAIGEQCLLALRTHDLEQF